jgi:hypothetical protein
LRPPDWQSCLRYAVVGVPTAVNISAVTSVYANVAGRDASVASAVGVDCVVAVDSAVGGVIAAVGILGPSCCLSLLLLVSLLLLASLLLLTSLLLVFSPCCYWCSGPLYALVGPAAVDVYGILNGAKIFGFADIPNAIDFHSAVDVPSAVTVSNVSGFPAVAIVPALGLPAVACVPTLVNIHFYRF